MARDPSFKGQVSDLGGPTANMYRLRCSKPEVEKICRRPSCVHPTVCRLLDTNHKPLVQLMRSSRKIKGVSNVAVASGIRMDLARNEPEYLEELARHHTGGHLKVAPEHTSDRVLMCMKKPPQHTFEEFAERFAAVSERAGKEQYLVPYFIASHPGSGVHEMIELALYLKARGYRPRQVQDFIPAPMDVATCMYHTGLDPHTMQPVSSAKGHRQRQVQRALLQYFKPENWHQVREILIEAGRQDLIGSGDGCLISARPPRGAWKGRQGAKRDRRVQAGEDRRRGGGYRRPARGGAKKKRG
jgi:uncharacterized radical SAM protein YgiQ